MPMTTEQLIAELGSEDAQRELAEEVQEAEATLVSLVSEQPHRSWTIRELQDAVAAIGGWRETVVSIAYRRALRRGDVLEVGPDLQLHAVT